MRAVTGSVRVLVGLALLAVLGSCGSSPLSPSAGATLVISGPGELAPGATAQFKAVARSSDGSIRDVTDEALWSTSNPGALSVSSTGLASGLGGGEGQLAARVGSVVGFAPVLVVPPGTFWLTVEVVEAGRPGERLNQATVEVTNSDRTIPIVTIRGQINSHRIYGVSGAVQLRVSNGALYEPSLLEVQVTGHQTIEVGLKVLDPPLDLAGTYTMVVTASASCASVLPEEARLRTYTAMVVPVRLWGAIVRLQSGEFFESGGWRRDSFPGTVLSSELVQFNLDASWGGPPEAIVVEALREPDRAVGLAGLASVGLVGRDLAGTMDGEIQVLTRPGLARVATCRASDHGFTLTRQ